MSRMDVAMPGVDGGMGVAVGVTCLEWVWQWVSHVWNGCDHVYLSTSHDYSQRC